MTCRYKTKALLTCYEKGRQAYLKDQKDDECPYGIAESRSGRQRPGPQHYAWTDGWEDARLAAKAKGDGK